MTVAKPPTRTEVRIAVGLTAGLLCFLLLLGALINDPRGYEFAAFYASGLIVRQGDASKLYDLGEQARIQQQLLKRENLIVDPHPPFEALLFAALARLSFLKAYILWGLINVSLWLVFQHLVRRNSCRPIHPYRYLLLCSAFFPLWVALMRGQTSVLLLLLFTLTFIGLKRGQDFRAGFFLGLGLFKFAVVLPFALICCLRRKWKLMAGFGVASLLLGLLSVITVGTAGVRSYADLLIDTIRHPDTPAHRGMRIWVQMPTVNGLFATLLAGRMTGTYISLLAAGVSALLILFVAWRWRREDGVDPGRSLDLMFAAALAVSVVTAPHLYIYDVTLMLLAVLLAMGSSQWLQASAQRTIIIAATVTLYAGPVYVMLVRRSDRLYILAPVLMAFALAAMSLASKVVESPAGSVIEVQVDES